MKSFPHVYHVFVLLFFVKAQSLEGLNQSENKTLYTFGDSLVDPGNNNYLITVLKSNFPPYGRDFVNHIPTGRFTNGRQVPDFIALYMGKKKYVRPYLDPTLSLEELTNALSFASAGSGFDPLTLQQLNVIPVSRQLEYFRDYKRRLILAIGKKKTVEMFENAIFYVSAGSNDIASNYYLTPLRRTMFTLPSYEQFLLQLVRQYIQGLWEQGARRIAFAGLPPLGCFPLAITLYSNPENVLLQRNCVESLNLASRDFNKLIQNELRILQSTLNGSKIAYIDYYGPLINIIKNPEQYGFNEVNKGCCGTGISEFGPLCNPVTITCNDDSKYAFWDSAHPSEKTYAIIFEANRHVIDYIIH